MNNKSINKTSCKITCGISTVILCGVSFFTGATFESSKHKVEQVRLADSLDVQQAMIEHYEYNADWNALFNLEIKETSTNCNKCGPLLRVIQFRLDSIKEVKGELVVSKYPGWSALE